VIQGAHYEPWRNRQSSEFAYERIPSIADHLHWHGGSNIRAGLGTAAINDMGGGHAHCGTMVYLGDNWPEQYRNTVFMNNIHGKRINNDILRRSGSGYTATHGKDVMISKDPWYMGVTLRYGPDGGAYASDWSDTGECHSRVNTRTQTGRIYKITYGKPAAAKVELARLSDAELVKLQLHKNDWHVQHARRLLQERAAAGRDLSEARQSLLAMFKEQTDVTRQLRALWALLVIDGLEEEFLLRNLLHESEYVRSWCIRILCDDGDPPIDAVRQMRVIAVTGESAFDRLHIASALQRLPLQLRWRVAEGLSTRVEDASDPNLPLMIWYGIEPLVHEDVNRFVGLAVASKLPLVRRHIARRTASLPEPAVGLKWLVERAATAEPDVQQDLLAGILVGLEGRRTVAMPAGWREAYERLKASPRETVHDPALQLAMIFDDPVAMGTMRQEAADKKASAAVRNRAVQALVAKKAGDLAPLLLALVGDPVTRRAALRGLAEYDHPATASTLVEGYAGFDAAAREDAVQTLASRPAWATALLDAVEAKRVPRTDLTAFTARQLLNLKNEKVTDRVRSLWGDVRETAADKARLIAGYKRRLTPDAFTAADRSAGRALFVQHCANCHKLFDAGGDIGPEITGAQRMNLDYLLENIVDPSASVSRDFRMQIFETKSGRVISGLVVAESNAAVTIRTLNEKVIVPLDEIEQRATSPVSMMPDGMMQKLSADDVRDLIAYLSSPVQVPLKPGFETSR
jgi:putative heme-binding domain-containing protein